MLSDPPEPGCKWADRQQCSYLGEVCVSGRHFYGSVITHAVRALPLFKLSLFTGLLDFLLLFHRCLSSCPTLVSLNPSGNPSVTSAGLHNIPPSVGEARRPLTLLNLEGMHMSELGDTPWSSFFSPPKAIRFTVSH